MHVWKSLKALKKTSWFHFTPKSEEINKKADLAWSLMLVRFLKIKHIALI